MDIAASIPLTPAQGFAYRAGASQRHHAQMVLHGDFAVVQNDAGAELSRAPLGLVQVDAPIGTAPRKLAFPDGLLFETHDHGAIDAMIGPTRGSILHEYEVFGPRLAVVVALCLAFAWALWRYGLDMLVAVAIWATPPAVTAQMDVGTLQVIDFAMAEETKLPLKDQDKVRAIFADLKMALPEAVLSQHDFTLLFRDMPTVGPNAFALPGGTMVITDDFVKEFPEPDVLAGVLGHEMGHVLDQHGIKRLYRSLGTAVLIAFLAGDVGPILEDIVLEGNVLLSLSHSRGQERDADAFGVRLAAQAGYSPSGLVTFFSRIAKDYGAAEGMEWLSTHPLSSLRVEEIETYIRDLPK
jgi:Zn-dependent protease with chaperone function